MKKKPTKRIVKAWAVIDVIHPFSRKEYIDVDEVNPNLLGIYISKRAGKEDHKDFEGKRVIPCEIHYQLTPKKK